MIKPEELETRRKEALNDLTELFKRKEIQDGIDAKIIKCNRECIAFNIKEIKYMISGLTPISYEYDDIAKCIKNSEYAKYWNIESYKGEYVKMLFFTPKTEGEHE